MRYGQEVVCDNCDETLHVEFDEPIQTQRDMWIYGTTRVRFFEDHIRISLDDWNEIKQLVIPALKQGDKKHATRSSKENESSQYACG